MYSLTHMHALYLTLRVLSRALYNLALLSTLSLISTLYSLLPVCALLSTLHSLRVRLSLYSVLLYN